MQTKRILWLYNHSTLIKSEVALLRELGYEVYVPKVIPFDVSVAVNWESDRLLSIPEEAIEVLNKVDFYGEEIPEEAMAVMNEYFGMAIFGTFIEPLKSIAAHYKGIMIFHPFGLEDGASYTETIMLSAGIWLMKKLEEAGRRFWFGQSYENLMEIECDFFKRRMINLPIGMRDTVIEDRWRGNNGKVLFICPRIKISTYYEKIYKDFKTNFNGIPHSIGGAQPIPVEGDKTVLGYLPQKEYDDLYPSHSVMYYHSTNKRHVHYHPFEAVKCGLPLIFMGGGLLDKLGGKDLPGRCESIKEAREKCRRIIKGDKRFANKVRQSQGVLLEKMSYEYCREEWRKAMQFIEENSDTAATEKKSKKIAVIMPQPYLGGVLDYTLRLLKAFAKSRQVSGDDINIVFAVPEIMMPDQYEHIKEVEEYGISIRTFSWEEADQRRIKELTSLLGYPLNLYRQEYMLMNDGISYFQDCDFLLFMADRVAPNLFLTRPYGVVIHDYMRRYVPEDLPQKYESAIMDLVRNSACNFTTTETAAEDCIQYVGAKREKIHFLPLFFDDVSRCEYEEGVKKREYFVWCTNINTHKNHKMALRALTEYYQEGGRLHCYVTGVNTDLFGNRATPEGRQLTQKQCAYIQEIKNIVNSDRLLKKYVHFKGRLPKKNYYSIVRNAKFMIHPRMADNGNGAVVDAAFLGVPSISSDYPAMRNLDEALKLGLMFFDKRDEKQLRDCLLYAEGNAEQMKQQLPTVEELRKHTIDDPDVCRKIYHTIIQYAFM